MKNDFKEELDALNPSQRAAVTTTDGRVLILAGAGSGKTKVLTVRMAYLMSIKGASPKSILGLTFTNKAAAEMRHRIGAFAAPHIAKQISLCTFIVFVCKYCGLKFISLVIHLNLVCMTKKMCNA
nr:UvrD-helicase domain-containing protein [Parachlamydia acanthamoebae]